MADEYLREAFNQVCQEAREVERWFVVLMERSPFYGGPQEGGWYGSDSIVQAYQEFPSREFAEEAAEKVRKLAAELTTARRREHGEHCLREMDWLEARGLDADYLPEPDGPSEYYVVVSETVPENRYGSREYS
jgi:hypothetical protein